MRKLLSSLEYTNDGFVSSSPAVISPPPSSLIAFPPLLAPSTSPSPSPIVFLFEDSHQHPHSFFLFPSITVDSAFDLATLCTVSGLLILSIISFCFVLHLRLRSRYLHHLQNFNSLWTVRLLLVSFASLWALNEVLRLPFFCRKYFYPSSPSLTLDQQANLCKVHVVLSLGFFEPGFLITLLFLVNVSIRKRLPSRMWALASVCVVCSPIFMLQIIFVFFSPLEARLPKVMHGTFVRFTDSHGNKTVLCEYPLLSTIIFGAFAIAYLLAFLLSCWRVVAFVINKSIRARINMLASTVMIALPLQILCLSLSPLWSPEDPGYGCAVLAMFICSACFVAVGQVILVIKPVTEALSAGESFCPFRPSIRSGPSEIDSQDRNL